MKLGSGVATLVNGAVTVAVPGIPEHAVVQLTRESILGTLGALSFTITPGESFQIISASILDQSMVHWVVVV